MIDLVDFENKLLQLISMKMLTHLILFSLITADVFVFASADTPVHIKELLDELSGSHLRFTAFNVSLA